MQYKATIFPYEYATLECDAGSIRLDFDIPKAKAEELVRSLMPHAEYNVLEHPWDDPDYYAVFRSSECMVKLRFAREDDRLLEMVFLDSEVVYNGVQLVGKSLKEVMAALEPHHLTFYISEPFMYLTCSGVLIYINDQATIPDVDLDWDAIERLLQCPVEGAAIDSGFLGTKTPGSFWSIFDTNKRTWYECLRVQD